MESPELPTLSYAVPSPHYWRFRLGRLAPWVVTAGSLWMLPALYIAYQNIRTIMVTGPLLLLMGLTSTVLCLLGRAHAALTASLMQLLFPILIFLVINLFDLGPDAAVAPVLILSLVFMVLLIPATLLAWWRRPTAPETVG